MDHPIRLTSTSYLVLGLLATQGRATSYELKARAAYTIGYVWAFPHAQLYTEPVRLAAAGLLHEEREQGGRNRRYYAITTAGRNQLRKWLAGPAGSLELRDPGLLRLLFSDLLDNADVENLARQQEESHVARLADMRLRAAGRDLKSSPDPVLGPLRLGLLYENMAIRFWRDIAKEAQRPTRTARAVRKKAQA